MGSEQSSLAADSRPAKKVPTSGIATMPVETGVTEAPGESKGFKGYLSGAGEFLSTDNSAGVSATSAVADNIGDFLSFQAVKEAFTQDSDTPSPREASAHGQQTLHAEKRIETAPEQSEQNEEGAGASIVSSSLGSVSNLLHSVQEESAHLAEEATSKAQETGETIRSYISKGVEDVQMLWRGASIKAKEVSGVQDMETAGLNAYLAKENASKAAGYAGTAVQHAAVAAKDSVVESSEEAAGEVKDATARAATAVKDMALSAKDAVLGTTYNTVDEVGTTSAQAFEKIKDATAQTATKVKDVALSAKDAVLGNTESTTNPAGVSGKPVVVTEKVVVKEIPSEIKIKKP